MASFRPNSFALRLLGASALTLAAGTASADFVINDDLIVDGSACIGFDCVNGEVFGFDTLRLKENNTRIQFNDTSVAASFPTNNWQIRANSSTNGGQSYLAIFDQDATGTSENGTLVFAVEANARANSLYVDDGGRIGSRTSSPSVEIHTIDGDTPTLRLQQDGSSGFEPQTWDVAGNETNFFVRDVTNGSTLPLRIRPGAPSSSIFIDTDGDVGIGTSSPDTQNAENDLVILDAGPARLALVNTASGGNDVWTFNSNDTLRVSAGTDASEFTLDEDGNLTIIGTLTTGGATCGGGCDLLFAEPDTRVIPLERHAELMWQNKYLPNVGPTPENQPFNMTDKLGRMLNELEHAHIYIEQLNAELKVQSAEIEALRQEIKLR